jgi:glucuronoarabinoxylan endo-1,4-beta-xylanase
MFRRRCILALMTSLLFSGVARAQLVTNVIDRFNTNSYPTGSLAGEWSNWFGAAFQSLSLDAAQDANTNATSGAMKITANFPVATDQFEIWNGINGFSPAISGFQFTNFSCDVKFAAGSATNSSGKFGTLEFGVPTPGFGQNYFGNVVVAASNTNWVHVSIALNANINTNLQNITGLLIHIWGAGLVGPSTLWVDNLQFIGNTSSGTAVINYTNTAQRIDGFGGSSAWDGTWNTQQADIFFSTNTGAGLSLLRTRIAPDGSTVEGGIAQMAVARGARVWSTPWTPPTNCKITNSWIPTNNPSGYNGGWISNSPATFQIYASQLARNVALMKNTYGVNLYALSIQNEPDANVNYESCQWSAKDFHDFLPVLDAALIASNVSSTKIILPESMHWQFNHATNVMSDATTSNLVDILAGHNYGSSAAPVTQFGTPCPKTLWETEVYFGSGSDITNGLALAQEIHSFLTVAGASAYHYWWLKTYGGNGCLAGDSTLAPAKRLYTMGNYSRFVRPDFFRIGVTNSATALVSAFKDPASSNFVIVAANNTAFTVNQTFTLTNFPVIGPLRQWVTSASESLANRGGAVTVTNGTFAAVLPPWTVTTYLYQQPVTNPPAIAQQPANQIVLPGNAATFSVQATGGTVALYYQWFFNGTNAVVGATNATLALNSVALTNAGNYSVLVTNFAGSVTSSVASLSVITIAWNAPTTISGATDISTNGTLLYAYNNSASSASVNGVTFFGVNSSSAWGTGVTLGGWNSTSTSAFSGGSSAPWNNLPAAYKTLLQGGAYNDGSSGTVTLNNLTIGRQYAVQVWVNDSRSGSTTNRTETLLGVGGTTVTLGYNTTYTGGGLGQYTIGMFTAYATNHSFTMDGNASTQLNALQVRDVTLPPPSIVQQPTNQIAWVGSNATFSVTASGAAPLTYQWFFNTTNRLAGQTASNLVLVALALTNGGNYSVVITNVSGSITSAAATLTVAPVPHPTFTGAQLSGANLIFTGTGGVATLNFYVLTSTNIALPLANWTRLATNQFNVSGNFGVTNVINATNQNQFYLLQIP